MRRPHARSMPPVGIRTKTAAPAGGRATGEGGLATRTAHLCRRGTRKSGALGGIRLRAAAPCGRVHLVPRSQIDTACTSRVFPIRAYQSSLINPRKGDSVDTVRTHETPRDTDLPHARAPIATEKERASFHSPSLSLPLSRERETIRTARSSRAVIEGIAGVTLVGAERY